MLAVVQALPLCQEEASTLEAGLGVYVGPVVLRGVGVVGRLTETGCRGTWTSPWSALEFGDLSLALGQLFPVLCSCWVRIRPAIGLPVTCPFTMHPSKHVSHHQLPPRMRITRKLESEGDLRLKMHIFIWDVGILSGAKTTMPNSHLICLL